MTTLNENAIEQFAIELFKEQNYQTHYGPDIVADGKTPLRNSFNEVVLITTLKNSIRRLNPQLPQTVCDDALAQVLHINNADLLNANQQFHTLLTEGITVRYQQDGKEYNDIIWLVDFANPSNNEFMAVNQFTVSEPNQHKKRPDVVLFVNGLPLVVMELKSATAKNATLTSAYQQLQTYKQTIPSLFVYNVLLVISDGLEARAGSLSAAFSRFSEWRVKEADRGISQLEILIAGLLNKATVLDIMRYFVIFETTTVRDSITHMMSMQIIKKMTAYHQYYAVNKAVESVCLAAADVNNSKGGVMWHTQGSGKSLSMVFTAAKLVLQLNNPTLVIITDRNDLDDQLFDTFATAKQLLRQVPVQAKDREDLKRLLKVQSGGIVFTTIQKFQPANGNVYDQLSARANIVVIADEAHRTQYGFQAKTLDDKDDQGNVIGKKIVYGFAKYMRDALPNATYLGFTGTPIEKNDANTRAVFGSYIDVYDIKQAVADRATVSIYYESRLAKISLSDEGKKLIKTLDDSLNQDLTQTQKAKAKWTQLEALIGSEDRISKIASDMVEHFSARQMVFEGKGMIVAISRRVAVHLYHHIIKLKPHWHSEDLHKGVIKVVMTASASDGPAMSKHHTSKSARRTLADRMRRSGDELKLVIVCDMWLTGFDVPCLHTLYIDKPMRGHNLMQAIARVNRVYKDKEGGLVVDYLGIASELKNALSVYTDSGGNGNPIIEQEKAVEIMLEKLEVVAQMFNDFDYQHYFSADTNVKLAIILSAEDYILGLENGHKRFVNEVTRLERAFALAIPKPQALEIKDTIAFFQAVKARLEKFGHTDTSRSDEEIETAIKQVIDQALVTSKVVDIFDAAGIKKPDISILSDEFLLEIKGMQHKNIALETLKKLLRDEIKSRAKKNLVQSHSLMQMLEEAIKKYHNKIITATEVIDELISLSKDIKVKDQEHQAMNLSDFEYAFYTAVADNKSAKELMQKEKLRELAVVLTKQIKDNASIDWTIKESVKAKLKVIVKRTLRKYGYPPDMEKLATETIVKQAELMATEVTNV